MNAFIIGLSLLMLVATGNSQQSDGRADSLTIDQAVQIALNNNPLLSSASASVQSAAAGLTLARSTYWPSITATGSALRTGGAFVLNPSFPSQDRTYNTYTAGISASQTILDFGRMVGRVNGTSSQLTAAESDYRGNRDSVITNVEIAYYGVTQAQQVVAVNQEALDRAADHLRQVKAFFSAGTRAQLDVTRTEVDLANANVNLIRARNQLRIARVQLENAMGVHPTKPYVVRYDFDVNPYTMSFDSVREIAFRERPSVVSAQARVAANESFVTAAWSQHLPTVSATAGYLWSNFNFPLLSRWNAGLTLTLPIFQGFGIQAQVEQAQASLQSARSSLDVTRENVRLDVEQSFLGVQEANERIGASTKLVDQAKEAVNLAEKQYAAGVGTQLEVSDAQLVLSNAEITRIQALYDYNSGLARLMRAMGRVEKR
jgi:outer membrane protein